EFAERQRSPRPRFERACSLWHASKVYRVKKQHNLLGRKAFHINETVTAAFVHCCVLPNLREFWRRLDPILPRVTDEKRGPSRKVDNRLGRRKEMMAVDPIGCLTKPGEVINRRYASESNFFRNFSEERRIDDWTMAPGQQTQCEIANNAFGSTRRIKPDISN